MSRFQPSDGASSLSSLESRTLIHIAWENSEQAEYFHGFVSGYAKAVFRLTTAERVILASHELLENALRYSLMSRVITYTLGVTNLEVRVSVRNSTISSRIEMLRAQLARIRESAERTYGAELERSMSSSGRRAMLGLVRISHEADMELRADIDASAVTVIASCRR